MKELASGYNTQPQNFDIIPAWDWPDASRREAFEKYYGTSIGSYGYEFDSSQYSQVYAVSLIGAGVAAKLNNETGNREGYRTICHDQFDNPDGTFSRGVILLGASSREYAERSQHRFEYLINQALEGLGANVRLGIDAQ